MNNENILKENNIDVESALNLWGDMDSYNDALKEYKEGFKKKLMDLEKYVEEEDWNNYAILTHSIKSESKYLGFMKEAEIFLEHELKGKENNGQYIK